MTAAAAASRAAIAAAIVLMSIQSAGALTGADLWNQCQTRDEGSSLNLACTAYIRGFVDGFVSANTLANIKIRTCIPRAGVSVTQARLIIEKYLRENPQHLHQQAGLLAMSAITGAFPCGKPGTSATK
jgi:hypothetical protein